nr:hypothetical protein [Candidatus Njordarchaeota archaeon]
MALEETAAYLVAILLSAIIITYEISAKMENIAVKDKVLGITLICIWLAMIQTMMQLRQGPPDALLVLSTWLGLAVFLFALCIVPFIISYWLTTRKQQDVSETK